MTHLIDKDALTAEIKKLKGKVDDESSYCNGWQQALHMLEMELDTLEAKKVDLEKALSDLDREIKDFVTTDEFENDSAIAGHYWAIAKHAFLLGLKCRKESKS